jgi:DHA2 family methylenomycin A resistance protein-like MFS transporter
VDAYAVPLAALLLACGTIGDLVGHRRVVLLGLIGFGGGSVACALAPTIGVLVAARAVQGIGAALMLPGTLALLVDTSSDEISRGRLVGAWAAIGGAALPSGPVIGGLLVQAAGWRAVFWLNVPVAALALVPVARLPRSTPRQQSAHHVDWTGAALLVIALTCVVTAMIQAPAAPVSAVLFAAAGAGALMALLVVERRVPRPLLPVPRASRRRLGLACLVAGLMNMSALGGLFLLTQAFQDVHQLDPLSAGLLTLPAMLPLPLLGAPAGRLCTRFGVWRTAALGLLIAAAGMLGIAGSLANPGTGYLVLAPCLALWGAGLGVLTPAIVAAALEAMPRAPGLASGASNAARQTGGAFGIAIFAGVAGPATTPRFSSHSTALFIGSAALFVLAGLLCFGVAGSHRRRPS